MRATVALLLVLLPTLSFAQAPARKAPPKKAPAATPAPTPEPAEPVEIDEAKAAERDQLLADAKHESDMAEFLKARELYRQAVRLDPSHPDGTAGLAYVEKECLENARRQVSEAKVYKAAFNYKEAEKSLALALRYADQPKYKEHQQIKDMIAGLKRETER